MATRVFISYSHKDEALRDRLEVQLSMLKHQGLIDVWHDRRLLPGDALDDGIHEELDTADVILLLVSPDFLASDYCYRIEKGRALERHRAEEVRVISVILRPCEWRQTELGQYLVTPKDGLPVTRWPDPDEAFLDVTKQIRRAIEELGKSDQPQEAHRLFEPAPAEETATLPRSSNLRLRKAFTNVDTDRFRIESFEYADRFFQGSLAELQARNPGIEKTHRRIDANCFTAAIYQNGSKVAACTIRVGATLGDITYRDGENGADNLCNESLSVEHDDQKLFLRPMGLGMRSFDASRDAALSQEGAAEYLWSMLIEPLQRR